LSAWALLAIIPGLSRNSNSIATSSRKSELSRSIRQFLEPLLRWHPLFLGPFESQGREYSIPRFTWQGPNSSDPIRIGLFGAIHGDEPAAALALAAFLAELDKRPEIAENFHLQIYPLCNPTGFEDNTRHNRNGRDLNREFWKGSSQPEISILERELEQGKFSGIVQLHADDTSDGIYGFVKGHTLTENLLRPALTAASQILPRNFNAIIDGFAARDGIIYDAYEGVLASPARMEPLPFEIVFETPHAAPLDLQVTALLMALQTILCEYRRMISFAANI
jgi:protein MpaA